MSESINKFVKYLEEEKEIATKEVIKEMYKDKIIEYSKDYFDVTRLQIDHQQLENSTNPRIKSLAYDEYLILYLLKHGLNLEPLYTDGITLNSYFLCYTIATKYLNKGNFKIVEKLDVYCYLAEKYLEKTPIDDDLIKQAKEFYIQYVENIQDGEAYIELLFKWNDMASQDIENAEKLTFLLMDQFYLSKKQNYTRSDADSFTNILLLLTEDTNTVFAINSYLEHEILKREAKEKRENTTLKEIKKVEYKPIDYKNNHLIYRKIMENYDIDKQRSLKPLNLEEIIYLASLMFKINIPESEIIRFIETVNKDFFVKHKYPFITYLDYAKKIAYYEDNKPLQEHVKPLESYVKELLMMQNSREDYLFWQNAIGEELDAIYNILKKEYAYELELARKLSLTTDKA